jgi:hypothetical protein
MRGFLQRPLIKPGRALLLLLAAFLFVSNWRFIAGYRDMKQAARALEAGDFVRASKLMDSASRHMPEEPQLAHAASFSRALLLMERERAAEAVPLLQDFRAHYAEPDAVDALLARAETAAAFERRDYDAFLVKAQALSAGQPGSLDALLALTSAYACKYAITGQPEFKDLAWRSLGEAKRRAGPQGQMLADVGQRVEHRLATREILSPAEFNRRYPRGWKKEADQR